MTAGAPAPDHFDGPHRIDSPDRIDSPEPVDGEALLRVLVVDDHPLYREGLRAMVDADPRTTVVGTAAGGVEATALARTLAPDVVVMDLRMPAGNGVDATRAIVAAHPATAVLVLTMVEDDESVFAAMRAGARGSILKGATPDEIMSALLMIAGGAAVFGPALAGRLQAFFAAGTGPAAPFPELTAREREVLDLLARGAVNAVIARRLGVSEKTVRNTVSSVFAKLRVADRGAAIVKAREAGLGAG